MFVLAVNNDQIHAVAGPGAEAESLLRYVGAMLLRHISVVFKHCQLSSLGAEPEVLMVSATFGSADSLGVSKLTSAGLLAALTILGVAQTPAGRAQRVLGMGSRFAL